MLRFLLLACLLALSAAFMAPVTPSKLTMSKIVMNDTPGMMDSKPDLKGPVPCELVEKAFEDSLGVLLEEYTLKDRLKSEPTRRPSTCPGPGSP